MCIYTYTSRERERVKVQPAAVGGITKKSSRTGAFGSQEIQSVGPSCNPLVQ